MLVVNSLLLTEALVVDGASIKMYPSFLPVIVNASSLNALEAIPISIQPAVSFPLSAYAIISVDEFMPLPVFLTASCA